VIDLMAALKSSLAQEAPAWKPLALWIELLDEIGDEPGDVLALFADLHTHDAAGELEFHVGIAAEIPRLVGEVELASGSPFLRHVKTLGRKF
jgi:hypothetical protein